MVRNCHTTSFICGLCFLPACPLVIIVLKALMAEISFHLTPVSCGVVVSHSSLFAWCGALSCILFSFAWISENMWWSVTDHFFTSSTFCSWYCIDDLNVLGHLLHLYYVAHIDLLLGASHCLRIVVWNSILCFIYRKRETREWERERQTDRQTYRHADRVQAEQNKLKKILNTHTKKKKKILNSNPPVTNTFFLG